VTPARGEKLVEAKSQMKHGEFLPWVQRNFGIKKNQSALYMSLAKHTQFQKLGATNFSSLSEFQRETGQKPADYNTYASRKPSWQEPVVPRWRPPSRSSVLRHRGEEFR
jgi:hypothetical protein